MQKGVSAIIVVVLLLMIVVAMAGLAYVFFSGMFTTTTSEAEKSINQTATGLFSQLKIESMSTNSIYIRNTGQSDLTNSSISVYVNDEPTHFSIAPPVVKPGNVGTVKIYDFIKEGDDIKIGTTQGVQTSMKAPNPCSDAVLCLKFDEGSGTTTYDSSSNVNNGAFIGESFNDGTINGATRVDGKFGKALQFDGIDNYVDFGNTANLNTNSLTVTLWLNLASDPNCSFPENSWRSLIRKGSTAGTSTGWDIILEENRGLRFDIGNGTSWQNRLLSSGGAVPINDWVHLAFVYDRNTGDQIIYKNGAQIKSQVVSIGTMQLNAQPVLLSKGVNTSTCPNQEGYVNGTIDEVRIWNRSLSQAEIQAEMQSSMPISRTVASYSFEESGQFVNDTHIWVQGISSPALSFDGIDDYVSRPTSNSLNFGTNSFTVTFWFKPLALPASYAGVIHKEWLPGWLITWRSTQQMMIRWGNSSTLPDYSDVWSDATKPLSLNNWHYIVFVVNRNTQKTYLVIDSVKHLPEQDCSAIGNVSNENDFAIGYENAYFNGLIDEVRIYNKAIY
jgi:FlaG/FlaF family flagellin (archaellin)